MWGVIVQFGLIEKEGCMNGFIWAASVCYLIAVIFAIIIGFMYLLRRKCFNYHEWVLGGKWEELDDKLQALILAFMKGVGGAIIGVALAMIAIIVFAFHSGQIWSYYTIPVVCLFLYGVWLYLMIYLRKKTNAKTPILVPAVGIALIVAGFVLSFF